MKTATTQMLNGELGSSPSVDASFELYVDSTTEVADYPMSVQLVCAAPVTSFDYDAKVVTVETEGGGDFKGRRFTFRQKDLTKPPSWADVSFSMDGTGADWLDDTGVETLFTVRASGFETPLPLGYADLSNILDSYLARGGVHAATHTARHTFDMNGALILSIRNVGPNPASTEAHYFQGWSAIRLMLKNAAGLTHSDITARAFIDGSFTSAQPPVKDFLLLRKDPVPNNDFSDPDLPTGGSRWLHVTIAAELDSDRIRLTIDARHQGLVGDVSSGNDADVTPDVLQHTGGTGSYQITYHFSDGSSSSQFPNTPTPVTITEGQVHHINVSPSDFGRSAPVTMQSFDLVDSGYGHDVGSHFYQLSVGNGTDTSGRPATVRLGPVVEGLRTLDLAWQRDAAFTQFDPTHEIHIAIHAPILKHLLVWEKTAQIPVVENDAGGRDSSIEVYYNPAASYSSGYVGPETSLTQWKTFSSQGLAIDLELYVALDALAQGPTYPMGGWRPDIAFGNPASVSLPPGRPVEMVDPTFTRNWPGLRNYAGTGLETAWDITVIGNKNALLITIGTGGHQLQVIVQVETSSGTYASFGIAGNVPATGATNPVVTLIASPEAICQALDGSHWTGRVRFSDLRNASPELYWYGGPPGEQAVIPVPAAYMPHAVRNIDITVTPSTDVTTVEAGTERGHFS